MVSPKGRDQTNYELIWISPCRSRHYRIRAAEFLPWR